MPSIAMLNNTCFHRGKELYSDSNGDVITSRLPPMDFIAICILKIQGCKVGKWVQDIERLPLLATFMTGDPAGWA